VKWLSNGRLGLVGKVSAQRSRVKKKAKKKQRLKKVERPEKVVRSKKASRLSKVTKPKNASRTRASKAKVPSLPRASNSKKAPKLRKTSLPYFAIIASAVAAVLLFLAYAFVTRYMPGFHLHSSHLYLASIIDSLLAPMPVILSAYVGARLAGRNGALLGVIVGLSCFAFGLAISLSAETFKLFQTGYEWIAEEWGVLYILLGYLCGVVGQFHATRS